MPHRPTMPLHPPPTPPAEPGAAASGALAWPPEGRPRPGEPALQRPGAGRLPVAETWSRLARRLAGRLRLLALGISPRETHPQQRGFAVSDPVVAGRLVAIGEAFLAGYHSALADPRPGPLAAALAELDPERRGFAYEGAGMAATLLDALALRAPGRRGRLRDLLDGTGQAHDYLVHVGAGWALARLPGRPERRLGGLDPLLRWLALDGWGFHDGYFRWPQAVREGRRPRRLRGYALRAYDQGLGRSLWFVAGADPERIAAAIAGLAPERRPDLWSGVGLGCAYAGGVGEAVVAALRRTAGPWAPELAQGSAFAAEARQRAGNSAPHTELACRVLCAMPASEAAALTREIRRELPAGDTYELWRRRIRDAFAAHSHAFATRLGEGR